MTRAEILDCLTDRPCDSCKFHESGRCERWNCVFEEKPDDCEDAISRQAVLDLLEDTDNGWIINEVLQLPSVNPQEPKTGHCKECKYFEYDSVVNVDGIPLIVAHEICSKWGDGCKTKEDGYCFLYEPHESEDKK